MSQCGTYQCPAFRDISLGKMKLDASFVFQFLLIGNRLHGARQKIHTKSTTCSVHEVRCAKTRTNCLDKPVRLSLCAHRIEKVHSQCRWHVRSAKKVTAKLGTLTRQPTRRCPTETPSESLLIRTEVGHGSQVAPHMQIQTRTPPRPARSWAS